MLAHERGERPPATDGVIFKPIKKTVFYLDTDAEGASAVGVLGAPKNRSAMHPADAEKINPAYVYAKKKIRKGKTMKKRALIILLCLCLTLCCFAACGEEPCTVHTDGNGDGLCDRCGAKVEVVTPSDPDTPDDGGEPSGTTPVTGITVSTDDETGDGSAESPFTVRLAQGNQLQLSYAVRPSGATDKTFTWTAGAIEGGTFTAADDTGLTFADNGTRLTITASATATSAIVRGLANDGSGVAVYLSVVVETYNPVTGITSDKLATSEDDAYNYIFVTALGTKWDMSGTQLARRDELVDGQIFGGKQAPHNLTYWPNLHNFAIAVAPDDATNPAIVVSYTDNTVIRVDVDGTWTALKAGETVVTVASYTEPDVAIKIKVVVKDTLYPGILSEDYQNTTASTLDAWDLDADHALPAQDARYDDWHLVMLQSNQGRGQTGADNNQKIFYMGTADRPYGICLENNVGAGSGGSLLEAASLMWAKVTIPSGAVTFNIKLANNDKVHGQYRVLFVSEDGTVTVLTDGWQGFTGPVNESTQKLTLPQAIKGQTGAMVIEHRVTEYDNNAELQIKVMKFEGQVGVTGVNLGKTSGTYKPGQSFTLTASVSPSNATNDSVLFYVQEASANLGVTVDPNTGVVTIAEGTEAGTYYIIAKSAENETITATYTLTVTADEIEVNRWDGKAEILEGVQGILWTIVGEYDAGVGEGADLRLGSGEWSALKLSDRKIKNSAYILTFGARVFHRDGETYPKFVVKVNGTVIRGIGQSEDWFYVDTDATQYCSYDLSAYIGETVTVEIGITQGTHAVVQQIAFTGTAANLWEGKAEMLDEQNDPWILTGEWDAGVSEGYDIKGTGSAISNTFVIGAEHNSRFTFKARVFHRDGETYPDIKVTVKVGDRDPVVIRANGVTSDTVHVDTDAEQSFTYDLSAYAGQEITISITLENAATHCVITYIAMTGTTTA